MARKTAAPDTGTELIGVVEDRLPAVDVAPTNPSRFLEMAIEKGASPETIGQFMALQERYEANEARKAYVRDMAAFKANPPEILKKKLVAFETNKGKTSYMHAELGAMCVALTSGLAGCGFSHSWKVSQEGQRITVTCTITHRMGHSESVSLTGSPDESGGKNAIQAVASTVTYLERYTLVASTGIVPVSMPDDDGNGAGQRTDGGSSGFDSDGRPYSGANKPFDQMTKAEQDAHRKRQHDEALGRHSESVTFIIDRLKADDLKAACTEWALIGQRDQMFLWLAPSKGGCLTTKDRETLRDNVGRFVQKPTTTEPTEAGNGEEE